MNSNLKVLLSDVWKFFKAIIFIYCIGMLLFISKTIDFINTNFIYGYLFMVCCWYVGNYLSKIFNGLFSKEEGKSNEKDNN